MFYLFLVVNEVGVLEVKGSNTMEFAAPARGVLLDQLV